MSESNYICSCAHCEFKYVVFENLNNEEIGNVCISKKEIEYKKGEIIIEQGKEINEFLYLKSGLVKLFKKNENRNDQIINIAKPFDFVSLLSVFSDKHYNFSISAVEDSVVCVIDLEAVKDLIKKNGMFSLRIMEKMSRSFDQIISENINLNKKNLRGKIAYVLLYFANEIYNSNIFNLPLSRKEIAQLIDMTTENVIRIFSEFRKDKIIRINGKEIEIINTELLHQISKLG